MSQNSFAGRIHNLKVSVEAADEEHVQAQLKQAGELRGSRHRRIFLLLRAGHSAHYTLQMTSPQPAKKRVLVVEDDSYAAACVSDAA